MRPQSDEPCAKCRFWNNLSSEGCEWYNRPSLMIFNHCGHFKNRYADLTDEQKEFLKQYKPANCYSTSEDEIKKIADALNLQSYTDVEELRTVRNAAVVVYSEYRRSFEWEDPVKYYDIGYSLMSVTAVIDHFMFKLNPESV